MAPPKRRWHVVILLLCCAGAVGAGDADTDLAGLQGHWVRVESNPAPGAPTIRKEIAGNVETTRIVDAGGNTLHVQTSVFWIERAGRVRLLHWSDAKVTQGPNKGAVIPDGTAVFTFKDGKWISVIGLGDGDPFRVYTEVWSRPAPSAGER